MIREGRALYEPGEGFYNPRAKLARDLGVLMARVLAKRLGHPISVLDLLAGGGIRGLRYALEAPVHTVHVNEGNPLMGPTIAENFRRNRVSANVRITHTEAITLLAELYRFKNQYNLIDADAFGSPAPFFSGVVGVARFGGLAYFTASDTKTLCGHHPKTSIREYMVYLPRHQCCHELGLRALLASLLHAAGMRGITVRPALGFWDGRALRFAAWVLHGKRDFPSDELGFALWGEEVRAFRLGERFEGRGVLIGPIYLGPVQDEELLREMLEAEGGEYPEARQLLHRLLEENPFPPWHFRIDRAADEAGVGTPAVRRVLRALKERGYRAVRAHYHPQAVKTDAPYGVFKEILAELSAG